MESHGGRIRAESGGTGLGTRFTFTIPRAGRNTLLSVSGVEEQWNENAR